MSISGYIGKYAIIDLTTQQYEIRDFEKSVSIVMSRDKIAQKIGTVHCLHWQEGIKALNIKLP